MGVTHYEVLGVAPDADRATIRTAYRRRARETHPDAGGSAAEFATVALAWSVLSDPEARRRYDEGTADGDDEAGWGDVVDLDWDTSDVVMTPAAEPEPPAEPSRPEPRAEHTEAEQPAEQPEPGTSRPIDPLTSSPRALPSLDRLLDGTPVRRARPSRRTVAVVCGALLAALIAYMVLASSGSSATGPGTLLTSTVFAALFAYGTCVAVGAWARTAAAGFATGWRVAVAALCWVFVAFFALMGAVWVDGIDAPTPAPLRPARWVVVAVGTAAGIASVLVAGRRVAREKRETLVVGRLCLRHGDAEAWNALLAAREAAGRGARILHRPPKDPRRRDSWVLLDRNGGRLAQAPGRAPGAWVELLREAGLDVADVREPRTRAGAPA